MIKPFKLTKIHISEDFKIVFFELSKRVRHEKGFTVTGEANSVSIGLDDDADKAVYEYALRNGWIT